MSVLATVLPAVGTAVVGTAVSSALNGGGSSGTSGTANAHQANAAQQMEAQIADDQWEKYKQLYLPVEQQYLSEAQNRGSIANQNKAAQTAGADVAAQFAGARKQLANNPGLDPSSQGYLEAENNLNLAEAANSAGAETGARENVRKEGLAAQTDALSLGKGIPATAMTGLAQAGQGLSRAAEYWQGRNDKAGTDFFKGVGGVLTSSGFKNWMNGSSGPIPSGALPNGYTDSGAGSGTSDGVFDGASNNQPGAGNEYEYSGTGT